MSHAGLLTFHRLPVKEASKLQTLTGLLVMLVPVILKQRWGQTPISSCDQRTASSGDLPAAGSWRLGRIWPGDLAPYAQTPQRWPGLGSLSMGRSGEGGDKTHFRKVGKPNLDLMRGGVLEAHSSVVIKTWLKSVITQREIGIHFHQTSYWDCLTCQIVAVSWIL